MKSGSEKRNATVIQRLRPETQKQLRVMAVREGISVPDMVDRMIEMCRWEDAVQENEPAQD